MGSRSPPCKGAIFRGKDIPGHARRHSDLSCAKMAESVEMPKGLLTRADPGKGVLGGGHTGATC